MRRHRGLILSLLFALAVFLVPFALADDQIDSHARIVRLSYVEGAVQIAHRQGIGYENATLNVPLVEGDQIRTADDGWAEIQFEDGSTVRLAPESQITFSALGRFSSGGTISEVDLDQGEAEFKLHAHDDSHFRVNVRQRQIVLKHSGRFRLNSTNADPLDLTVWKGEVAVIDSDTDEQVAVKKNETFTLDPMDASRYDLENETQADDLDRWSSERDDYLSAYAGNRGYAQSPYQYGVTDLNYYGQYYNIPGYGYCWQPYGVNLGWDPFANGYWTYSPGFGYVWISAYPWGWMPYRYGQWVFVNGYGWVWQPGLWNRWVSVPRITNPPSGFRAPAPPALASTPVPATATKFDGSPARMTMRNPALNATSDKNAKPVISNEHTPVRSLKDMANPNQETAVPAVNQATPLPPVKSVQPAERFHPTPPVQTRPLAITTAPVQQPRVVNTPPSAGHVSPPAERISPPPQHVSPPPAPVSRPSPPPSPSVSVAPRSFSPPPAPASVSHSDASSGRPKR